MTVKIKLFALCAYLLLLESRYLYVWAQVGSESCSGRCGQSMSLPCSCHSTCVVYNNCCEDINLQCPEILTESQAKFDKNVHTPVKCTDDGVFMITGCLKPDQVQNDTTPRSVESQNVPVAPEETSVISEISNFADKSKSVRALFTMLSSTDESMKSLGEKFLSAPVTDASTGLVYKNFTVFSCDATNLSVPHIWKASASVSSPDGLDNVRGLSNALDTAELEYTPPDEMSSVTHCRPDCLDHCEKELDDETEDLRNKCEDGGFTYVVFRTSSEAACYKNMHCGQCNMNKSFVPSFLTNPYSGRSSRKLSVLTSLSGAKLNLSPGNDRSKLLYPWEKMTCPIEKFSAEPDDDVMKCHVTSCPARFVKRPDGVCRFPASDKFAVADDDVPLTADDIRILPKFVECLLKEALHDEIVLVRPDVNTVYDTTLNTMIHVTDIESFAKYKGPLLETQENSGDTLAKLSAIVKSFQKYRQAKRKGSENTTSLNDAKDGSRTSNTASLNIRLLTMFELSVGYLKSWDRGAVVDNVTKTTTCFCRGSATKQCRLQCLQDLWYVGEDDIISEFLDLPCVADVKTRKNQNNNQAGIGQKLKVWVLVFMICIQVIIC